MSASAQQKLFNQYPVKSFNLDVWYGVPKHEKRASAIALCCSYLLQGGKITKAAPTKRKGGRPQIFQKDSRAVKSYEHWNKKFLAGDDFVQKGPRFLSRPLPEHSAAKRDAERKAGVAHATFSGAVIDIVGKLAAKKASHATTETYIDMVSDAAEAASAKRGGGKSHKIEKLIEDGHDDVTDAYRAATIRDDFNLNGVDHVHNAKFKLAA